MRDIHSHILFGIDDGSRNLEETMIMLEEAESLGITEIAATSHYVGETKYQANCEMRRKILNEINAELAARKMKIKVYMGNEVFIDDDLISKILKKQISTINNSSYLLVEISLNESRDHFKEILRDLISKGCVPILAHAERYRIMYKNFDLLEELIEMGVLIQSNLGSLVGLYDKESKWMLKAMLKRNMVHFIGTDMHHKNELTYLPKAIKKLIRITGEERSEELLNSNFSLVVNNQTVTPYKIKSK